jgi:hypothetical protein
MNSTGSVVFKNSPSAALEFSNFKSDRDFVAILKIYARANWGREFAPWLLNSRGKQKYLASFNAFPCLWPHADMSPQPWRETVAASLACPCGKHL